MKRITRDRQLTPEEAAKYRTIREQVAAELPDLRVRHHERMAALDQLDELLKQLKAAREAKGLSLADVTDLTGMDRARRSRSSKPANAPTPLWRRWCATLRRWASALWSLWPMRDETIGPEGIGSRLRRNCRVASLELVPNEALEPVRYSIAP